MYKTYFIKCSSFLLFLSLLNISGSTFAQKITVSGLPVKKLSEYSSFDYPAYENIIVDGNGEYNESNIKFDDSPNVFDPGCTRIGITYEISVDVNLPGYFVIKAYIFQHSIDECLKYGNSVVPLTRLFLSFNKPCINGIPCDGWSDGARLSGACTTHPDIPAPIIAGKTDICPGESTTLHATCEYGNPIWEKNGIVINPYLYTGTLDQTTTYKVKCGTDCKEGPESAVTVTVHNSAVQSIAHSVLPGNQDVTKAVRLTGPGSDVFKICVDAGTSSLFTVKGTCLVNISTQIEAPSGINNPDILGSISQSLSKPNDYESDLHLIYRHPSILPEEHPEPYSVNTLNISKPGSDGEYEKVLSRKLHIYPAPVAMVHGIWSSKGAFLEMEKELSRERNGYPANLVRRFDYEISNDRSFQENAHVIPDQLQSFLGDLVNKGYAVRKADIVGHSMGGLLARQYVQSSEYYGDVQSYRDDVRKLIFINTPHSGSPWADQILDPRYEIRAGLVNKLANRKIYSGAVGDLMVNSTQIDNVLNNSERTSTGVPYHAIVTTKTLRQEGHEYEFDLMNLVFEVIAPDELLKDTHDLVVPRTSQWGGLPPASGRPDYITEIENIEHMGSAENANVIKKVGSLLTQDPNSGHFSHSGLKPENLVYNGTSASPWLGINSLSEKSKLRSGNHARYGVHEYNEKVKLRKLKVISIDAGKNCRAMIINTGGASSRTANGEITFDIKVPDVAGKTDLIFLAIAETGQVAVQTTNFIVSNSFCESTKSGLWNSTQSWSCGHIPTADDPVIIKSNHVITIPQGFEGVCSQIEIESGASLKNQGGLTVTNE